MTDHTFDVFGCVRCHNDHVATIFVPFDEPVRTERNIIYTHWAPCPVTGEPIMMRMVEKP